jgi:hypothetical protein
MDVAIKRRAGTLRDSSLCTFGSVTFNGAEGTLKVPANDWDHTWPALRVLGISGED